MGNVDIQQTANRRGELRAGGAIPMRRIRYSLLAVFFILTFGSVQFLPSMAFTRELWIACAFLFLIFPYSIWKVKSGFRFSLFELYILFVIFFIPIISSISAWKEFGQPIIYGMLSERRILLDVWVLAICIAFRKRLMQTCDIENAMVMLAWGSLFTYLLVNLLVDPSQLVGENSGIVLGGYVTDARFGFDSTFIIFGFYYFSFLAFHTQLKKYLLFSLLFFLYLVFFDGGRSLLLALISSLTFYLLKWSSPRRLLSLLPKAVLLVIVFVSLVYATNSDWVTHKIGKFSDAFTVVTSGDETEDSSSNARIGEVLIAIPYILENWLLGNGSISNQWHDGYEGVLGGYYYPSDIGIVGVIYKYGLVGSVIFAVQFLFAFRFSKQISDNSYSSALLNGVKGFLLYFAIHSLVTGKFALYPEVGLIFIALMGGIAYESKGNFE